MGFRQPELLEEDAVHSVGIVLARVQDEILHVRFFTSTDHRGHFYNLWSRPENDGNSHFSKRYFPSKLFLKMVVGKTIFLRKVKPWNDTNFHYYSLFESSI